MRKAEQNATRRKEEVVRLLENEVRVKGGDSVFTIKSDEPFHSSDPGTMTKPSRMRNNMKSVWTEQDSVYGNQSISQMQFSKEYSFPNRDSPANIRVEIPDSCNRSHNSSKVDDIETE